MKRTLWHILARFYEARSRRAYTNYLRLKSIGEEFYYRLGGRQ